MTMQEQNMQKLLYIYLWTLKHGIQAICFVNVTISDSSIYLIKQLKTKQDSTSQKDKNIIETFILESTITGMFWWKAL